VELTARPPRGSASRPVAAASPRRSTIVGARLGIGRDGRDASAAGAQVSSPRRQQRYEDARRTTRLIDALRTADAHVAAIRRAGRRTGVLLAADLDPRHVVALAVVRGALVAKRRLPRAGDPGLELTAVARELERALAPAATMVPRARARGCRRSATPRPSC